MVLEENGGKYPQDLEKGKGSLYWTTGSLILQDKRDQAAFSKTEQLLTSHTEKRRVNERRYVDE